MVQRYTTYTPTGWKNLAATNKDNPISNSVSGCIGHHYTPLMERIKPFGEI